MRGGSQLDKVAKSINQNQKLAPRPMVENKSSVCSCGGWMLGRREAESWVPGMTCDAEWRRSREVAVRRPGLCWSYCNGPSKRWWLESQ